MSNYQDDLDTNGYTTGSLEQILRSRSDIWNFDNQAETAISYAAQGGRVSPEMRMAMGYYQTGKKAAEAAGRDVTDPNAPKDGTNKLSAAFFPVW
jgi:hypothetical protein